MAEAVQRNPELYGSRYNEDGTPKPLPRMSGFGRKKKDVPKDIPKNIINKLPNDGWKPKPVEPIVTGTEVKIGGRSIDLTIWEFPENCSRKEYNRIWMHNDRVRKKIKLLKEKYGDAIPL